MTDLTSNDTHLGIDVGTISTRAILYDVVNGRYRFIAKSSSPTTAGAPIHNISEGIIRAINQLQKITGRNFISNDEELIIPSKEDGSGIDSFAATLSAGPPLKVVAVGLLEDMSAESACRLASNTYAHIEEVISLNDRRSFEGRIDTILRIRPDLVIIAGGTKNGASLSVRKLIEAIGISCYLLPKLQRPEVIYAGNNILEEEVRSTLDSYANLYLSPNIRPSLEIEQLHPAQKHLSAAFRSIKTRQIPGVKELSLWTGGKLLPTSTAFGRIINFLSKIYDPTKGVLGIDVGASATSVAAAFSGKLALSVFPHLGLGADLDKILQYGDINKITRWLSIAIDEDSVRDYLHNKTIYPGSIPATDVELALEYAIARQVIRYAVQQSSKMIPDSAKRPKSGLLPWFEPIMVSGSVFSNAPKPGQTMLALLDGIQPTGVSTIILDQNDLSSTLGAAASVNPTLVVQVLESSNFQNLGTVISPVGIARLGTPIVRVKANLESGDETSVEVEYGSMEVLPVPFGQTAQLHLQPLHRFDVGMGGPGRAGKLKAIGGSLGVIIDGRGRPLHHHEDPVQRIEQFKKWLWLLGN